MSVDPRFYAVHADLMMVLRIHGSKFTSRELLAIVSQMTGHLIALQVDKKQTMELVQENIETGNRVAIEQSLQIIMKDRPNG